MTAELSRRGGIITQGQRVAIVTGSGQGIGRAIAWELARQGASVAVADLSAELAGEAAKSLNAQGHDARPFTVDVSSRRSVDEMVKAVNHQLGSVNILVNNAGIAGRAAPLQELSEEEWDHLMAVDLKSLFLCCREVLPGMIAGG